MTTSNKSAPSSPSETIILIHGLGSKGLALKPLELKLRKQGYQTKSIRYPSLLKDIPTIAREHLDPVIKKIPPTQTVHFVTHSMGGIILRHYLSTNQLPNLGRIVMIAPPNKGCEIVDLIKQNKHLKKILRKTFGASLLTLGTDHESVPLNTQTINAEIGIIAGDNKLNFIGSNLVPKPNDGTVSVESTKLPEMTDFIITPANHTFMPASKKTMALTENFLKTGKFLPNKI